MLQGATGNIDTASRL